MLSRKNEPGQTDRSGDAIGPDAGVRLRAVALLAGDIDNNAAELEKRMSGAGVDSGAAVIAGPRGTLLHLQSELDDVGGPLSVSVMTDVTVLRGDALKKVEEESARRYAESDRASLGLSERATPAEIRAALEREMARDPLRAVFLSRLMLGRGAPGGYAELAQEGRFTDRAGIYRVEEGESTERVTLDALCGDGGESGPRRVVGSLSPERIYQVDLATHGVALNRIDPATGEGSGFQSYEPTPEELARILAQMNDLNRALLLASESIAPKKR